MDSTVWLSWKAAVKLRELLGELSTEGVTQYERSFQFLSLWKFLVTSCELSWKIVWQIRITQVSSKICAVQHNDAKTWKAFKQINKADLILSVEPDKDPEKQKLRKANAMLNERIALLKLALVPFVRPTLFIATQDEYKLYLLQNFARVCF